jgi:release factor glutamine methyltransferase
VFRPRSDTWLLARTACGEPLPQGARILELCAGPGLAGLAVAERCGGVLTTVDVSRRAVLSARLNAWVRRVPIDARRGDLFAAVRGERFDLIIANPPYVPGPPPPRRGAGRATDAGADGRAVLDRVCAGAPAHLVPGGRVLIVQSEVCDPGRTLEAFLAGGLEAEVAASEHGTLGPLLRSRRDELEAAGRLRAGQETEHVLVLGGRLPTAAGSE